MVKGMSRREDVVIYANPVDPDAKRLPWYRWIPNNYRAGRQHDEPRRWALIWAVRDWWVTRDLSRDA